MLTEDGIRYRVRHDRLLRVPRPGKFDDVGKLSPWGGRTTVQILDPDGNVLATGEARCRPDENYNRRLGRTIALGRARKTLQGG